MSNGNQIFNLRGQASIQLDANLDEQMIFKQEDNDLNVNLERRASAARQKISIRKKLVQSETGLSKMTMKSNIEVANDYEIMQKLE